ncbi:uncharacterized protein LOC117605704 isoform X1 [Osmia lignaria lignaria]|uniref:uncharacterized protein LOC117605704 isoform X1 n=1 Tax=Osmia lignaria lignaria TaxID=1437193 RepID=UPI00402B4568
MKTIILVSLLMAMCLLSEVRAGTCKGYGDKDLNVGTHYINCTAVSCHPNGSVTMLGCASYRCQEGKQIGYRQTDLSKPYPECCEGPICAD